MFDFLTDFYEIYIYNQRDPRLEGYLFMDSPKPTITLCLLYLAFVKYIGPAIMKNREPLEIKGIIIAYNAFQTLFSLNMFIQGCMYGLPLIEKIYCTPHTYSTDFSHLRIVFLSWLFLVGRFIEFFDTVFFILRKKNNQVTTLHVVHHFMVPMISWVGVKIVPGSHYVLAGFINAFVHTFMYLYYLIAAMGPEYKKYLWWKKYMTVLQLIQFFLVILHTIATLVSNCDLPQIVGYLILGQAVIFFVLFWSFYREAFNDQKEKKSKKDSKPLFNVEKYYQRYRTFFEMCIPNQNILLTNEDDDIQNGQKLEDNQDILEQHIIKKDI